MIPRKIENHSLFVTIHGVFPLSWPSEPRCGSPTDSILIAVLSPVNCPPPQEIRRFGRISPRIPRPGWAGGCSWSRVAQIALSRGCRRHRFARQQLVGWDEVPPRKALESVGLRPTLLLLRSKHGQDTRGTRQNGCVGPLVALRPGTGPQAETHQDMAARTTKTTAMKPTIQTPIRTA